MKQRLLLGVILIFIFVFNGLQAQSWIVKDSILVFPEGFSSWLKRHNGGPIKVFLFLILIKTVKRI